MVGALFFDVFTRGNQPRRSSLMPGQLTGDGALYLSIPGEIPTKAPLHMWGFCDFILYTEAREATIVL
jgi:hypothetical protein